MTHSAANVIEVAIAILHQEGQFLLQLRDDDPSIFYPGHWAFFGGHLDPGESPDMAIRRELLEEIGYAPARLTLWERLVTPGPEQTIIRHIYQGALEVPLSQLVLGEGQELGLASPAEIRRGDRHSQVLGEARPMGAPHQGILLRFMAQQQGGLSAD